MAGVDQTKVMDALRDTIDPDNRGVMVNKYFMVAEIFDSQGVRGLVRLHDDSMALWDAIGMLESIVTELKMAYAGADYQEMHGEE